jgi:hypothetical protein
MDGFVGSGGGGGGGGRYDDDEADETIGLCPAPIGTVRCILASPEI